jgi:chromate transport protein ChrA
LVVAYLLGARALFRGLAGAILSITGMLIVPLCLLMLVSFKSYSLPAVDHLLTCVVAAAAGMALFMGLKILHESWKDPLAILLTFLTFIALQVAHFQLIPVVLVGGSFAVALYWPRAKASTVDEL